MPPRYRGPKARSDRATRAGPADRSPPQDGRRRCDGCGAPLGPTAIICSMCHARVAPAPARAAAAPTPAAPRQASASPGRPARAAAAPSPARLGRRAAPSFGQALLDAAASVASDAAHLLSPAILDRPLRSEFHYYRERQRDLAAREQTFAATVAAQAQAGLLDPVDALAAAPDDGYWQCPRTGAELEAVTVEGLHLHVNRESGGAMIERVSERHLMAHPELWPAVVELSRSLAQAARVAVDGRALVYLSCPTCGGPMVRRNFEKVSGVMVDGCPRHGTWFDAGELEAALAFLERGGQQRRAEFEAQERAHIAQERRRIRRIETQTLATTHRRGNPSFRGW